MTTSHTHLITDPDATGIGTSRRRPEASAKVRGEFEFAPDVVEPGMLWGATLRSPHPHARLIRVDLNPAKAMAGVHAVLGGWDVPDNRYGAIQRDKPVLADEVVTYVGEPIAIVAAEDPEIARRALDAIVVEYEILDPIVDALEALDQGRIYRHVEYTAGDPSVVGEVQAEGVYTTPRQDHSYLGLDGGVARPDGRGGVVITGATQWVHSDRAQVAAALGQLQAGLMAIAPERRKRRVCPPVGRGLGKGGGRGLHALTPSWIQSPPPS